MIGCNFSLWTGSLSSVPEQLPEQDQVSGFKRMICRTGALVVRSLITNRNNDSSFAHSINRFANILPNVYLLLTNIMRYNLSRVYPYLTNRHQNIILLSFQGLLGNKKNITLLWLKLHIKKVPERPCRKNVIE